jgi:hypothetical protein
MKNVMIDLETMSTKPNAAILSIGAVVMNLDCLLIEDQFYQNIELSSCVEAGLHESVATRDWWAKPENREARDTLTKNAVSLRYGLEAFQNWVFKDSSDDCYEWHVNSIRPWGNGASFDLVILESAYEAVGFQAPWKFYNHMCFRTMKNQYPLVPKPPRSGLKHNALDDAVTQAHHLFAILRANSTLWQRMRHRWSCDICG